MTSAKFRILVADDDECVRGVMRAVLAASGYSIVEARDGEDALRQSLAAHFDLLLMDHNMPNMSGIEMIKELRKQPWCQSVPIMAITAYGNGVAKDALAAGADRAATKPIQFNAVIVEIKELLADKVGDQADDRGTEKG